MFRRTAKLIKFNLTPIHLANDNRVDLIHAIDGENNSRLLIWRQIGLLTEDQRMLSDLRNTKALSGQFQPDFNRR